MFSQTLKNFCSYFVTTKRTTADKKEISDPALSAAGDNESRKTARLLYHRDIKHTPPEEKAATPHDWWIN